VKRVVIIGAGGHGREIAEILKHQSQKEPDLSPLGYIDDDRNLCGKVLHGLPILGDWEWFKGVDRKEVTVVCAVGSPRICRSLTDRAADLGLEFVNAISPSASISSSATLGRGVIVFPNTVVSIDCLLADYCVVNVGATISHDTRIGRYSNVNPGARLAGNVSIGEGCYVGMGASVIQGRSIGDWTVVGAGAVVTRDLPGNVTAVGVPAAIIKNNEKGN
jgi:sugar O-acyltransferase (sialic acid O-acetyltransferase NeuD family)